MNNKTLILISVIIFVISFFVYICMWVGLEINQNSQYTLLELLNVGNIMRALCLSLIPSIG